MPHRASQRQQQRLAPRREGHPGLVHRFAANREAAFSRVRARRLLLHAAGRALAASPAASVGDGTPLRNLLLIRPDHLGDVLWLTAGSRGLRERFPEANITVAVGPWSKPALANNPDLDAVLPIAFPGFARDRSGRQGSPFAPYRLLAAVAREMRHRRFDAALVLRDDHWWGALLAASAGIPRRFGYGHPDVAPFLTDTLPLPPRRHAARNNIALLDALLLAAGRQPIAGDALDSDALPEAWPTRYAPAEEAATRATALLPATGLLIAIQPGAGVPVKLWDEGRWAAVADRLAAEYGARILLTGGPDDAPLTQMIAERMAAPALDLAGKTSFEELGAIFARCALVVGPDGGGLHLAVAVGAPTVHLYGPADPVLYGPWGSPARHRVVSAGMRCDRCGDLSPSRPRGATCMLAIGVADVLRAARALLAATLPERSAV